MQYYTYYSLFLLYPRLPSSIEAFFFPGGSKCDFDSSCQQTVPYNPKYSSTSTQPPLHLLHRTTNQPAHTDTHANVPFASSIYHPCALMYAPFASPNPCAHAYSPCLYPMRICICFLCFLRTNFDVHPPCMHLACTPPIPTRTDAPLQVHVRYMCMCALLCGVYEHVHPRPCSSKPSLNLQVRAAHDTFLREYFPSLTKYDVPLLRLNVTDWESPFSIAQ